MGINRPLEFSACRMHGLSLILWLYFTLLFDGIVLLLMYNFSEYPIEKVVLFISFLNPVDLGRIIILMQTEAAALMGYSGAVFESFFTTNTGLTAAFGVLLLWTLAPVLLSVRLFSRKDF